MPLLVDPLPAATRALLRRAVVDHAGGERRRRHPSLVHLGRPGGVELAVAASDSADHALRVDVLAALLRRHDRERDLAAGAVGQEPQASGSPGAKPPWVWLTRTGPLELQDVDVVWLAAARAATAEAGRDLTMVVVTRHGWLDPRTGLQTVWTRVRRRS